MNRVQLAILQNRFDVLEAAPRNTTLQRVQNSAEVAALGSRDDGSLSENQKHLIATVVTVMQDDMAHELRGQRQVLINELEAQRRAFIEWSRAAAISVLGFARRGMFTAPKAGDDDKRPLWMRLFTWGHFLSGSAIVLVAVAGFTTHTYLAYKDLAETRKSDLATLEQKYDKQSAVLATAQAGVETLLDKITEHEKDLVEKRAEITVLKSQLELKEVREDSELQIQLNDAILKLSAAQTAADKGKPEAQRLREQVATLTQIRNDIEDERDALRTENRQKAEAIASLTKKLAKEGR